MEIWKDVKDTGWKVSNMGNMMKPSGRIVKFRSKGYRKCAVGMVHRIVAYYFCNPPAEVNERWVCKGYEVHHKNKNPYDNRAENLVYLTHEEHKKLHNNNRKHSKGETTEITKKDLAMLYLNALRG